MRNILAHMCAASTLALAGCSTIANRSEMNGTEDYSVKSHVEKNGQGYCYKWSVHNQHQRWGLDQFAIEVPIETHVVAHSVPPPYSDANAYWIMQETREAQVDPHDGRSWLPAAKPGRKWLLWSGLQSPSVYPPDSTATFSLATDTEVLPGTVPEVATTYTPQNNPHYYLSFHAKVIGPSVLPVK